jgi:hypothetical protein
MPQYVLLLRDDPKTYASYSPQQFQELIEKYRAWAGKLAAEGRILSGKKLQETGGKVLRKPKGGRLVVKDGPFAEAKEIVGGFYLIKADDYAHAVKLCEDHPQFASDGFVEIREVDFMGGPESE